MGRETLPKIRDGSMDPSKGLGRVYGPTEVSETGRGKTSRGPERSGDPRGGLRRVAEP